MRDSIIHLIIYLGYFDIRLRLVMVTILCTQKY